MCSPSQLVSFYARWRKRNAQEVCIPFFCEPMERTYKQGKPSAPETLPSSVCFQHAQTHPNNGHHLTSIPKGHLTISPSSPARSSVLSHADSKRKLTVVRRKSHPVDRSPGLRISALPGTATANNPLSSAQISHSCGVQQRSSDPSSPSEAAPRLTLAEQAESPPLSALTSHSPCPERGRECVK
jgi:hypothetical protein